MCRGAEAEESDDLTVADLRQFDGAVADDACTEQRGGLLVGEYLGNRVGEILTDNHILCIAAVGILSGPFGVVAEVFAAGSAETAFAATGVQPGYSDPLLNAESAGGAAFVGYCPYYLVAQDYRPFRRWESALDFVEGGMAQAAERDLDEYLVFLWNGPGQFGEPQPVVLDRAGLIQHHCLHPDVSRSSCF